MKEIDVTDAHDKKYLEYPNNCPICDSDNISGAPIDAGDNAAWREVSCLDCGAEWTERFELTGLSNLHIKDEEDDN